MEFLTFIPFYVTIILVLLGTALIIVEMLLPGLGAPGIGGAVLCVGGVLSMFNYIGWSVMWVVLGVLLILIGSLYFITSTNRKKKNPLILTSSINESDQASAHELSLNDEGIALTELRPAGSAMFFERKYDVLTSGEFIEKNARIKILKIEGNKIIVCLAASAEDK